ncbi:hypothetical protein [Deinococcus ruber]|nr:hypothetical protein [Deinococcus ruber]
MIELFKQALVAHASSSAEAGFEAYTVAVAVRELNPPIDRLPIIVHHLAELAVTARGSVRDVERHITRLCGRP